MILVQTFIKKSSNDVPRDHTHEEELGISFRHVRSRMEDRKEKELLIYQIDTAKFLPVSRLISDHFSLSFYVPVKLAFFHFMEYTLPFPAIRTWSNLYPCPAM